MKAASTDDRFQDDKKGGPILTEGALSSRPSYWEDGAGGAHLPGKIGLGGAHLSGKMGPGGLDRRGAPKFYDTGKVGKSNADILMTMY